MTRHRIAIIAGDGIGKEVIPCGIAALEGVTRGTGVSLSFTELPWGCEYYLKHRRMMDEDGFERLAAFDAVYLGAIGSPAVPDDVSVWELLLPLRQRFEQYVNLRPMRLLPGLTSPLANRHAADIDMICVRENTEGEYAGLGGRLHVGTRATGQQGGDWAIGGPEWKDHAGGGSRRIAAPTNTVWIIGRILVDGPDDIPNVRQQFVKVEGARGDQIGVVSGVNEGEEIVTSGVFKLRNGAAVAVNNKIQPANSPTPKPEDN